MQCNQPFTVAYCTPLKEPQNKENCTDRFCNVFFQITDKKKLVCDNQKTKSEFCCAFFAFHVHKDHVCNLKTLQFANRRRNHVLLSGIHNLSPPPPIKNSCSRKTLLKYKINCFTCSLSANCGINEKIAVMSRFAGWIWFLERNNAANERCISVDDILWIRQRQSWLNLCKWFTYISKLMHNKTSYKRLTVPQQI